MLLSKSDANFHKCHQVNFEHLFFVASSATDPLSLCSLLCDTYLQDVRNFVNLDAFLQWQAGKGASLGRRVGRCDQWIQAEVQAVTKWTWNSVWSLQRGQPEQCVFLLLFLELLRRFGASWNCVRCLFQLRLRSPSGKKSCGIFFQQQQSWVVCFRYLCSTWRLVFEPRGRRGSELLCASSLCACQLPRLCCSVIWKICGTFNVRLCCVQTIEMCLVKIWRKMKRVWPYWQQ